MSKNAQSLLAKEALSVLMLCAPNNRRWPFSYHTKISGFEYFRVLSVFSWKRLTKTQKSVLNMACSDSQIDKPQRGCPKRTHELPDVNINTGVQSINTERGSLSIQFLYSDRTFLCILNPLPAFPIPSNMRRNNCWHAEPLNWQKLRDLHCIVDERH